MLPSEAELMDAYASPLSKTSTVKSRVQAIKDGDWLSGIHIWLYRPGNEPVVFCQQRGAAVIVGPGKLEATASGHYMAGEHGLDGLRELQEETGVALPPKDFTLWGRRLYVGTDTKGRERKAIIDVYAAPFAGDLSSFTLQADEVDGMFMLPIKTLLEVIHCKRASFMAVGVDANGKAVPLPVNADSLPRNMDDYHHHMIEYLALTSGAVK